MSAPLASRAVALTAMPVTAWALRLTMTIGTEPPLTSPAYGPFITTAICPGSGEPAKKAENEPGRRQRIPLRRRRLSRSTPVLNRGGSEGCLRHRTYSFRKTVNTWRFLMPQEWNASTWAPGQIELVTRTGQVG